MNELIEKVENLKESISFTKQVKEIEEISKEIMKEKDLIKDIEEFNRTQSEEIKERILNNKLFREYKKKETDLNILILEINQRLKEITDKGKCC